MKTQNQQILAYLKKGKSITALDALNMFGCFRLASRVNELKEQGHNIEVEMVGKQKRFAKYSLK